MIAQGQLPVIDGFRAGRHLREAGHAGPIVPLTANGMKREQERCITASPGGESPGGVNDADGQPRAAADGSRVYGGRVLLVDDNADAIEMLSTLLEAHDIEVSTAQSGAEALERALEFVPHVVVLDLGLPDLDGYAVLEHLQALQALRSTRFIALSGRSGREEQERMRKAGFHHQLVKPPDFNHLIDLIKMGAT
jgi:CheY-like chemotaxis protein